MAEGMLEAKGKINQEMTRQVQCRDAENETNSKTKIILEKRLK